MSQETESKTFELCPPPLIREAVPPTIRVLTALLSERGDESDLLFSLGCVYLRRGDYLEGVDAFLRALKTDPENPALHCNLAVGYMQLERWDEASASLKRTILIDPSFELAFIHLAKAELGRGDRESAFAAYHSATELEGQSPRPYFLLGDLLLEDGRALEARERYQEAFQRGARSPELTNRLGAFIFEDGLACYQRGEFEEAQRIWGEGFLEYERAFVSNQEVSKNMHELVLGFNEEKGLEEAQAKFQELKPAEREDAAYDLALRLFFSLGRMPDLYVSRENTEQEFARWYAEIEKEEDSILPFAHYRIGVLLVFTAQFDEAISKLSFARDHLPISKHRPLKIDPTLRFLKDLLGTTDEEDVEVLTFTKTDWSSVGFTDPFQYQAWSATGLKPQRALRWKQAGFSPKAAQLWQKSEAEPEVARVWQDAGFDDPDKVRRWLRGGFDIAAAQKWQTEFSERLEIAIQCRQAGFEEPEEAAAWLEVFMFPWEAEAWKAQNFALDEARVWVEQGVKDPFLARQYQTLKEPSSD